MVSVRTLRRLEGAAVVLLLGFACGCASVNLVDWKRFRVPKASAKDPVTRIVGIWEAAEGQGLDGKPTRGFAGQILFFTHGKASPVGVSGDVTIELFDGPANAAESSDPIHRFDFVGDAWTIHLTDSVLGPSYNVFIPYTPKHAWRANCGLRVQLQSSFGTTAYSEMVHVTLPGRVLDESRRAAPLQSGGTVRAQQEDEALKLSASLERRTIKPAAFESDVVTEQQPSIGGKVMPAVGLIAPSGAGPHRDEVFQQNLEQIEKMLEELKQQQRIGNSTVPPAEPEQPAARHFQLQPAARNLD